MPNVYHSILIVNDIYYNLKWYPNNGVGTNYRKDLPGPKGVPIFGNLFTFMFKKNTYIELEQEWANKYGSLYTFTIFKSRHVVSNDPQTLEYVLKTNFKNFKRDPAFIETSHDLIGEGIFTVDGSMWKFQRKLISQQFQGRNFKDLAFASVIRKSEIMINHLKKYADSGKLIDLKDLFFRFTIDTFGDLTFGIDFECLSNIDDKAKFVTSFEYAQAVSHERVLQPFRKLIEKYSKKGQRMHEACKYLDDYIYKIINSHRSKLKVEKKPVNNMLTLLMDAVDDNGKKFNDKELRDIILSLIIAEKPIPLYDDIKLFKYTTATFYETLRLYPIVPVNGKVCIKNDVLPNNTPIYAGEYNNLKPNKFKFASFHAGPRTCLGEQLATLEVVILAIMLLKEFKFELASGQKFPPEFKDAMLLQMKDPLMTKVSYRTINS
ncbi:cytochrome P450 [Gigaspora rosea]|uniref:Cytochrome P450 n=1 Tax=Gigaspora rosea TaxID=44941 RepID=A0A397UJM5_9GLOM|nr:cytochrome P450 [Gigaspora rosea]